MSDTPSQRGEMPSPGPPLGNWVPVVVLDLGPSGLEVCRAFGRRGIPVFGMDRQPGIAAQSRYCRPVLSADPRSNPAEAVLCLIDIARQCSDQPVLMPLSDEWMVFVSRHRRELQPHFRWILPGPDVVESLTQKTESYHLARRNGIDVPRHAVVEDDDDLRRAACEVGYPCVLKPARTSDWSHPSARSAMGARKIVQAHDFASLSRAFDEARPFAQRHVLEELIPGPDTNNYYVVCYIDSGGQSRARFVHRKILMRPPGRGVGCLIESVQSDNLANRTTDLLLAVGHVGLAGLEFKEDPRDGHLKLLDLNPRWGQGDSLAALCGIDMAWLYYCDTLGAETLAAENYRTGVKWVQLRSYLRAAVSARRERRLGLLRSVLNLRGELHHSVLAWDDLRPAAWTLWDLMGGRFRRRHRSLDAAARMGGARDREAVSADARDGDRP